MLPPATAPRDDRRSGVRRPCHRPCLVRFARTHLDGQPGSVAVAASVADLSAHGIGLLLRHRLPPGTEVTVCALDEDRPDLPLAGVVRCVPLAQHWHHGCTLARRLTEDELRAWLD
jgi:hypothetical protein